jgi:hypothetical protein
VLSLKRADHTGAGRIALTAALPVGTCQRMPPASSHLIQLRCLYELAVQASHLKNCPRLESVYKNEMVVRFLFVKSCCNAVRHTDISASARELIDDEI